MKKLLPPTLRTPTKIKINNDNYRLEWYRMRAEQGNDANAEDEYYDEIMAEGRVTKIFDLFQKKFDLKKEIIMIKSILTAIEKLLKLMKKDAVL